MSESILIVNWLGIRKQLSYNYNFQIKRGVQWQIKEGKLKTANPVDKGSRMVTSTNGILTDGPFNESKEVIAGYFLIDANDMEEAVSIAKANPIFNDIPAKIEVHPMMPIGG